MNNIDKYLNLSEEDFDNILFNVVLDEKPAEQQKNVCVSCKSPNLKDTRNGIIVCETCGVINREYLDENPDIVNNDGENQGNSHYGAPTSVFFPQASLSSKIVSKHYSKISRLHKQGQMPYKEKSLMDVLLEMIQTKCHKYKITQTIIDCAKILYKKVSESTHAKGKRKGKNIIMRCVNRRSIIAACLFHACKLQKEARSPKEIADIYDLEIKHVNRGCRKFCDIIDANTLFNQIKSSKPCDFIERFAKKLNIDKQYIQYAKDVSNNILKLDLASTHEPPSVAAGCILVVCQFYNIQLSKKQISDIFGISDVTISKTFRKIWPLHKIILNNKITDLILEKKNNKEMLENSIGKNKDTNQNTKLAISDDSDDESSEDEDD